MVSRKVQVRFGALDSRAVARLESIISFACTLRGPCWSGDYSAADLGKKPMIYQWNGRGRREWGVALSYQPRTKQTNLPAWGHTVNLASSDEGPYGKGEERIRAPTSLQLSVKVLSELRQPTGHGTLIHNETRHDSPFLVDGPTWPIRLHPQVMNWSRG